MTDDTGTAAKPRPDGTAAKPRPDGTAATPRPSTPLGVLRPDGVDGTGRALRLERRYPAPPTEVWDAIVDPVRAARWLGEVRGDPVGGEGARLVMGDGDDEVARIRVTACEPPHRLEVAWDDSSVSGTAVTVTLAPVDGGTLLVLDHRALPVGPAAGFGCGWHHFSDALGAHLAGTPAPDWAAYYPALLPAYRTG